MFQFVYIFYISICIHFRNTCKASGQSLIRCIWLSLCSIKVLLETLTTFPSYLNFLLPQLNCLLFWAYLVFYLITNAVVLVHTLVLCFKLTILPYVEMLCFHQGNFNYLKISIDQRLEFQAFGFGTLPDKIEWIAGARCWKEG